MSADGTRQRSGLALAAGWLGFALHLMMGVWYAESRLVAPIWGVLVLLALWALLTVAAWRLLRSRPTLVLVVPVADAALWLAVVSAGDALLGWTA
jgi:hypothetical protein